MSEKSSITELYLDGLECGFCQAKIGDEVSALDGVKNAKMDFSKQMLTIDTDNIDIVMDKINKIISRHEHEINIREKIVSNIDKKVMLIVGLGCAGCGGEIEKAIREIEGVADVKVDFASSKLTIKTEKNAAIEDIIKQASQRASYIEKGIRLLEEREGSPADEIIETKRKRIMISRLIISAVFLFALILIKPDHPLSLSLYILCYLIAGYDVLFRALRNISKGRIFDENFLMSIATIGAIIIGEYPEAVAVMIFYHTGDFLQSIAVQRSRRSIKALIDLRPDTVNLIQDDQIEVINAQDTVLGSRILIRPGERIPLDGKIIKGATFLDTAALTGESMPKEVSVDDDVLSGSINLNGVIEVIVTKAYNESTVTKILELVENASARKSKAENFISKFASVYTPVVVSAAILLAFIPPLIYPDQELVDWVRRALIFLVVSCPCALVISIPLGFFAGIGVASRNGILVKGGNYLEALNTVDTIVFDKTGTLTQGVFSVKSINPVGVLEDELLGYAAIAEAYSSHPIAASVLNAFGKDIDKDMIDEYDEIYGYGIIVKTHDDLIIAGNLKLMRRENISGVLDESDSTVIHVAVDGKYIGNIQIEDKINDDSFYAIRELKKSGIKNIYMFTGDSKKSGEATALDLGIDRAFCELLPHQKVELLEEIKEKTKAKVLFIGDGINDAPVLARADIGVAMGGEDTTADAAIEAADIVFLQQKPSVLIKAFQIASSTKRIVWQNIWFALLVKAIVLVLGAGGLATLWEAVFADVGVSIIAVLNASRILKIHKKSTAVL